MINASQKDSLKGAGHWSLYCWVSILLTYLVPTNYIMLIDHQPITPENIMDLHI